MWRQYDDNCKTTTIQLSWDLNVTMYDNIDILPIPTVEFIPGLATEWVFYLWPMKLLEVSVL